MYVLAAGSEDENNRELFGIANAPPGQETKIGAIVNIIRGRHGLGGIEDLIIRDIAAAEGNPIPEPRSLFTAYEIPNHSSQWVLNHNPKQWLDIMGSF